MTPADWQRFQLHAAPDAIEHELRKAQEDEHRAAQWVKHFGRLLDYRREQIKRGEWPA